MPPEQTKKSRIEKRYGWRTFNVAKLRKKLCDALSGNDTCSICFRNGYDDAVITPCGHIACFGCMSHTVLLTMRCPFCRLPNLSLLELVTAEMHRPVACLLSEHRELDSMQWELLEESTSGELNTERALQRIDILTLQCYFILHLCRFVIILNQ